MIVIEPTYDGYNRACSMGKCVERDPELTDALRAAFAAATQTRFERGLTGRREDYYY